MPAIVFNWTPDAPVPVEPFVGVILRWKGPRLHVGFFYRTGNSGPCILHLLGHNKLKQARPQHGDVCVICNVVAARADAVRQIAERIYRENKQVMPMGFSSPHQTWFSATGKLMPSETRIGLTCANFVLAVFYAARLPLVLLEEWPPRDDDIRVQQQWIADLAHDLSESQAHVQQHFRIVAENTNAVRCRPLEVGGAALSDNLPCDFRTALRLATQIEFHLGPAAAAPAGPAGPADAADAVPVD